MKVSDAIRSRRSIRAFRDTPVPEETVREILEIASRAPSGGNLQPWKVYVLAGDARDRLVREIAAKLDQGIAGEGTEYNIYPPDLAEPYRGRRRDVGNALYDLIGVAREDRPGKLRQLAKNYAFFGAPVGMIFAIDRRMEPGQWADLGMFMQNVMLIARERGLHTCPQEAWANWHKTLADFLAIPAGEMVFAGIALGHADENAVINELYTERAPVEEFARFFGYETGTEQTVA